MTRKEELKRRALSFLADEHVEPSDLTAMLLQVEREVWNRAASHLHKVSFLYGNDSWRERSAVKECANWCRDQQQELA